MPERKLENIIGELENSHRGQSILPRLGIAIAIAIIAVAVVVVVLSLAGRRKSGPLEP